MGRLGLFHPRHAAGTSDIHLTLVQTVPITGAVIVSTPQHVALADARKGINMYQNDKVNVPILGLVENMAWFTPAELPQNKYYLFGKEGVKRLAEEMNVPLLGQIPIVQSICENGDGGTPEALNDESLTGQAFMNLAREVAAQTARRQRGTGTYTYRGSEQIKIHTEVRWNISDRETGAVASSGFFFSLLSVWFFSHVGKMVPAFRIL